ncbi:MAG: hypothetical protein K6B28_01400, partial [Lachnospiraceae bacterium]|nr:hypothetical protein [Lachnospiraceae bacterium]
MIRIAKEKKDNEKQNKEVSGISIPYILKGCCEEWEKKGRNLTGLNRTRLLRAGEKYESIKEYLTAVKNGIHPDNIGILLRIPYTSHKRYCMMGPAFAALLLREYDLAKELIERGKTFEVCGLILDNEFGSLSDSVFVNGYIFITQLFLADLKIPEDILLKIIDRVEKDHLTVSYHKALLDNDLLRMLDSDYEYNYGNDPFSGNDKDRRRYNLYEKLYKKSPEVFEWLFKPFVYGLGSENLSPYGNIKWIQTIGETVYRHYSESNMVILGMFTSQAGKFMEVYGLRGVTEREFLSLYKSACFVLSKVKEDEALLKWYLKLILFMLNVIEHRDKYSIWVWTEGIETLIGNKLAKLLKKGMNTPAAQNFDIEDLCMHAGSREGALYFNNDICSFYSYYPGYLETYRKYTGKRTVIDVGGDIFIKHAEQIGNAGLFVNEAEIRNYRQELKSFIFNTDVFYFKCSDKKKAKKPVLRRFNDNMKRILSIADEEIILAGY